MQCFLSFKNECDYHIKVVREQQREEVAWFTIAKSLQTSLNLIDEQIDLVDKILEYEQGGSGVSFDGVLNLTINVLDTMI